MRYKIILFFIPLVLYANTLSYDYVYLDDSKLIRDILPYIGNVSNIADIFRRDVYYPADTATYWRPMLTLSFMTGAIPAQERLWVHRLINISLLASAGILLYVAICELGYGQNPAFVAAAVFLAHPMLTQAATWLPGRNDSILAVFCFGAFIALSRYIRTKKFFWLLLSIGLFVGALLTKETALIFPIVAALWILTEEKNNERARIAAIYTLSSAVLIIFWFLARAAILTSGASIQIIKVAQEIIIGIPAIFIYIGKVFFPIRLSPLPTLSSLPILIGVIAVFGLALALMLNIKSISKKRVFFGTAWIVAFIIPTLYSGEGLVIHFYLDHRFLVPSLGLMIIVLEIIRPQQYKRNISIGLFVVIVFFAAISFSYSPVFANRLRFWETATAASPNLSRAHTGLGTAYLAEGKKLQAETEYKKAIELDQENSIAYGSLGILYADSARAKEAEDALKKAVELRPRYTDALLNLGIIYFHQGRFVEAKYNWERVIEINPNYLKAHEYLAIYYYETADFAKSAEHVLEVEQRGGNVQKQLREALKSQNAL